MQTKKIFIASSAELKNERLELVDLMEDITQEKYKILGIKLIPELWEYVSSSMQEGRKEDEYLKCLKASDICIVLFWQTLGTYTVEELDVAIAEMQAGRKPKEVYVLFKNPAVYMSPEMKEFLMCFAERYPMVSMDTFDSVDKLREKVTYILANIID